MASSSVSQDDIDNDFEKNSRRSRIRTARARAHLRLESGGDRSGTMSSNNLCPTGVDITNLTSFDNASVERGTGDTMHELADSSSAVLGLSGIGDAIDGVDGRGSIHVGGIPGAIDVGIHAARSHSILHSGAMGLGAVNSCTAERVGGADRAGMQAILIPPGVAGCISGITEGHETSPKPGVLRSGKDKTSIRNKLHHVNKGENIIFLYSSVGHKRKFINEY